MNPAADREQIQLRALDLAVLLDEARRATGLRDYGDEKFLAPLERLLTRAAREVRFLPEGLQAFRADCLRWLVNRLRVEQDLQRHPEILDEDVSDPIIVIGLPRSGTTKMQRMLAAAPDVQKLYLWRMLNPAPFPESGPGGPDPRRAAAGLDDIMASGNEAIGAAHAMAAAEVDEECVLFDFTGDCSVNGLCSYVPLLFDHEWFAGRERQEDRDAYRYVRTLLQYLQWQDGGKRGRPWVMKAIIHIAHLEALTDCFPNATIVHCHRDPHSAIPSFAKMMCAVWSAKAQGVEPDTAGRELLRWGATVMERCLESRERLRLGDRILDVHYDDIRDHAMTVIQEVYRHRGREATREALEAMRQWELDNEQGKLGSHRYAPAEFGLTTAMIDQAFATYIHRFISPRAAAP